MKPQELWKEASPPRGPVAPAKVDPTFKKLPRAQLWRDKGQPENTCQNENKKRFESPLNHGSQAPKTTTPYSQRKCICLSPCPRLRSITTSILKKFDQCMSKNFRKLGHFVASQTGYFIIVPVLLALLCGTGVQRAKYETNPEYLFAPIDSPARNERAFVESYFSTNFSSSFDPTRVTRAGKFVRLIISAKDGGTILKEDIWNEIIKLDRSLKQMTIAYEEENYRYENLCAIWNEKCFDNKILGLSELMREIENGTMDVNYPIMLNPYNMDVYILSVYFGGVEVNEENGTVTSVKAVLVNYWLRSEKDKDEKRSELWEKAVLESFTDRPLNHIQVARFTSKTLENELEVNARSVIPYMGVTVLMMVLFCVGTLFMSDWVRSKPYVGLLGILASLFACQTAFGLLFYVGVPFIGINLAAPFLMLGIGMDDMYVMLGAWRRTRLQDSVKHRLGEAYAEASVSITITSLTDMLSFFIGIITPFPSVQIFCIYTGTAVLMTYLWHITFFGACLAISGRLEASQRHSLCCLTVKSKSEAEVENSLPYYLCCAGGINKKDAWNPKDNEPHAVMVFFRDYVAYALNIPLVKGIVLFLFMIYLCGAIYGCSVVTEGLERRRLSRYDSYSVDYYDMEDKYFREFPYRIQVVITGDLEYSSPETRASLLALHRRLEREPYVAESLYTESWIRGAHAFVADNESLFPPQGKGGDREARFVRAMRENYLSGSDNVYQLDVKFNADGTRIQASRFIIQTYRVRNSNEDKDMMEGLREIAHESPLNVTVFHPFFIFFDQFVLVRSTSIKTICIAAAMMIIVSLIFIPNPWCSLWVGFSIISIEIGVVGYMTLWGVNLDSISMINLIMCIGFSVDFSAHICYAYLTAKVNSPEERVRECLFNLGFPIFQGAISTIIGVIALAFAPSYIFLTFFKTVFLVIFFGAIHGIFLLPVLLSILGPDSFKKVGPPPEQLENVTVPSIDGTIKSPARVENIDKDMGLGTSEESSNNSSLSGATGASSAKKAMNEAQDQLSPLSSLIAYNNNCFMTDENFCSNNSETMGQRSKVLSPRSSESQQRSKRVSSSTHKSRNTKDSPNSGSRSRSESSVISPDDVISPKSKRSHRSSSTSRVSYNISSDANDENLVNNTHERRGRKSNTTNPRSSEGTPKKKSRSSSADKFKNVKESPSNSSRSDSVGVSSVEVISSKTKGSQHSFLPDRMAYNGNVPVNGERFVVRTNPETTAQRSHPMSPCHSAAKSRSRNSSPSKHKSKNLKNIQGHGE